ncbi:MAG: RibD family protein [Thomasclavelia sp.]
MEETYIICHMLQSLDGKISGNIFLNPVTQKLAADYRQIGTNYQADAIIYGKTTAQELFITEDKLISLPSVNQSIVREDYLNIGQKNSWIVVIDGLGTLAWNSEVLKHDRLKDKNIVVVLSEKASDEYLLHLQKLGISYLFAGKKKLRMRTVVTKMYEKLKIKTALLQGGGIVNASFANENLIDEISLVIAPVISGASDIPTSFESGDFGFPLAYLNSFKLIETRVLDDSGLWLNYQR